MKRSILSGLFFLRRLYAKFFERKLSHAEFIKINKRFAGSRILRARYLEKHYHCRTLIDPALVGVIKRLREDFALKNFVETGTYDGETSFFFSCLFAQVFTCDNIDHARKLNFISGIILSTRHCLHRSF